MTKPEPKTPFVKVHWRLPQDIQRSGSVISLSLFTQITWVWRTLIKPLTKIYSHDLSRCKRRFFMVSETWLLTEEPLKSMSNEDFTSWGPRFPITEVWWCKPVVNSSSYAIKSKQSFLLPYMSIHHCTYHTMQIVSVFTSKRGFRKLSSLVSKGRSQAKAATARKRSGVQSDAVDCRWLISGRAVQTSDDQVISGCADK